MKLYLQSQWGILLFLLWDVKQLDLFLGQRCAAVNATATLSLIIQVAQTRRSYLSVLEKAGLRVSLVHLACHVHLETVLLWCSLYEPSWVLDDLNTVKEEAFHLRRSLREGIV